MNIKELTMKLSNEIGISGYEKRIRPFIVDQIKDSVDSLEIDSFGNIIAKKNGKKEGPTYLLISHIDEVGFVINHISDEGMIHFVPVGGVYDPVLVGQPVTIHTKDKKFNGVIAVKAVHMIPPEDRKKYIPWKEMYIDVGATSKEDLDKAGIKVSDPITFARESVEMLNNFISGKGLDNRAGTAVLIKTLQELKDFEGTIYGVFSTQEEIGLKGSIVSAYGINPDIAISIDTCLGKTPDIDKKFVSAQFKKGPTVFYMEAMGRGAILNPKANKWVMDVARKNNIPFQVEVGRVGMTDASGISIQRGGIATISIGIPAKYLHSPIELTNIDDLETSVVLLKAVLKEGFDIENLKEKIK